MVHRAISNRGQVSVEPITAHATKDSKIVPSLTWALPLVSVPRWIARETAYTPTDRGRLNCWQKSQRFRKPFEKEATHFGDCDGSWRGDLFNALPCWRLAPQKCGNIGLSVSLT